MKIFKNVSQQGFSVPFKTPEGVKYAFIGAKRSFETPDSWSSQVANTLVTRRMFKITSVATPTIAPTLSKKGKLPPRENR